MNTAVINWCNCKPKEVTSLCFLTGEWRCSCAGQQLVNNVSVDTDQYPPAGLHYVCGNLWENSDSSNFCYLLTTKLKTTTVRPMNSTTFRLTQMFFFLLFDDAFELVGKYSRQSWGGYSAAFRNKRDIALALFAISLKPQKCCYNCRWAFLPVH